jgi:DNA repair protein SbcD/Mre11
MKIVILGDAHFGAGYSFGKIDLLTGHNTRLLDYENTLSKIIDFTIENKIELFIFLGDIFETRKPAPHQMVIFYRQLKRLSDAHITTLIIAGNHDETLSRHITSSLDPLRELQLPYIHTYNDIDTFVFTDSNNEKLNVILMPFRNRQCYDKNTNAEAIDDMAKEIEVAKEKAITKTPTILAGHMMLENTIPSDAGDYGLNELVLPFKMFEDIDITICGHIHRASILKENPLFIYSGSMECKDFSEKDHQKCFLVYDSNKTGIDAITFKAITTRKFIDFEFDFTNDMPENPMETIINGISKDNIKDAVVKVIIKVQENKLSVIDTSMIRNKFYELGVNCVADVSMIPVILKQLRNQKVNDAPDEKTAFKHYILSQQAVADGVLEYGLEIMNVEIE